MKTISFKILIDNNILYDQIRIDFEKFCKRNGYKVMLFLPIISWNGYIIDIRIETNNNESAKDITKKIKLFTVNSGANLMTRDGK